MIDAIAAGFPRGGLYVPPKLHWLLVYGTPDCEPAVVVVATQVVADELVARVRRETTNLLTTARLIAGSAVPVLHVRFGGATPVRDFGLSVGDGPLECVAPRTLAARLESFGLNVRREGRTKAINDRASSSYHDWQRATLSNENVITDVDAVRFRHSTVVELLELKRSRIPLEQWRPYEADAPNFRLLYRLGARSGYALWVAYTVLTSPSVGPRVDVLDRVSVMRVSSDAPAFADRQVLGLQKFLDGEYSS